MMNTGPQSFYSEYIVDRKFWVGIEYMTPESRSWWAQRLGHEAYMHFGKQVENERKRLEEMSEEERIQTEKNKRSFAESMSFSGAPFQGSISLLPKYVHEAEEFMGLRGQILTRHLWNYILKKV